MTEVTVNVPDPDPNQIRVTERFEAKVRHHQDGTFSLIGLTRFDLQKINDALGQELTNNNVAANQPAPHWWHEGVPSGDHKVWFLSWVDYFRGARAVIEKALD